jgi:hypothetical protein
MLVADLAEFAQGRGDGRTEAAEALGRSWFPELAPMYAQQRLDAGLRLLAYPVDGDRFAGQVREGLDRHASVPHGADQNLHDHPMGAVERPR